jgi:hypothetical protein
VVDYIYAMQLSFPSEVELRNQSGFIGSSYLGLEYSTSGTKYNSSCSCEGSIFQYMQSHIAMTYSAISALKALGDDLQRVDREAVIAGQHLSSQEILTLSQEFDHFKNLMVLSEAQSLPVNAIRDSSIALVLSPLSLVTSPCCLISFVGHRGLEWG